MQPKIIDFDKGVDTFVSNGNKYFVQLDRMAYEPFTQFIARSPEISYGITIMDVQRKVTDLLKTLSAGNDLGKNYVDTHQKLINLQNSLKGANSEEYFAKTMDLHLEFCALFVHREGEDTTKYDPTLNAAKIEDWKKDMDMMSFFLLARLALPGFKEMYQELHLKDLAKKSKK